MTFWDTANGDAAHCVSRVKHPTRVAPTPPSRPRARAAAAELMFTNRPSENTRFRRG